MSLTSPIETTLAGAVAAIACLLLGRWFERCVTPAVLRARLRGASPAFAQAALSRVPELGEAREEAARVLRGLATELGRGASGAERMRCALDLFWTGLSVWGDDELLRWRRSLAVASPREAWGPVAAASWKVLADDGPYAPYRRTMRSLADSWLFGAAPSGDAGFLRLALDFALLKEQMGELEAYNVLRRAGSTTVHPALVRALGRMVTDAAVRRSHGGETGAAVGAEG
ncbi:MAG: hypothetical protein ACK41F_05595 [Fimbriimonadaceae bacterium]